MIVHKNIRVTGRVQGVYYRASTADMAKSLGLKGFVRNEPDGSVYLEVEGESEVVDELVAWCRKGPAMAHVIKVEISEVSIVDFKTFEIRR